MRFLTLGSVLCLGAALLAAGVMAAPAASLPPVDEAGYTRLVQAQKGKVVLVNFWATWCVPCRQEMPQLAAMEKRLRAKGFDLITISADEPEQEAAASAFLQKAGIAGAAYLKKAKDDDKFINLVEPKWSGALPALLLYDRSGKKVAFYQGETDLKKLEAAIQKLL